MEKLATFETVVFGYKMMLVVRASSNDEISKVHVVTTRTSDYELMESVATEVLWRGYLAPSDSIRQAVRKAVKEAYANVCIEEANGNISWKPFGSFVERVIDGLAFTMRALDEGVKTR